MIQIEAKKAFDFIDLMRRGGRVKRFHTELFIGEETVAAHSYGVVSWVLALSNFTASKWLLMAAIYHDTDEQILGDIPGPAKWYAPDIIEMVEQKQQEFREEKRLQITLSEEEQLILKWADKLDLLITCYEQQQLGSAIGLKMCCRVISMLETLPVLDVGNEMLKMWLIEHPEHFSSNYERNPYYGI